MTIIKQQSVTSKSHQKNLRNYINNDEKVLLRAEQNMLGCHDLHFWSSYMSKTREDFGHNKSSRRGKDGKEAANTILYHQIIAFLPDECDVNGGKLTPELCMQYAKEYAQAYYPNQQIVFALHNEYCKEDKTHRYAVHMVINRSDLSTGKRLAEGRGASAKRTRAKRIRTLDEKWGLKQVEEGKENSAVHKAQITLEERGMAERDPKYSVKTSLRDLCRNAVESALDIYHYREILEGWGIDTQFRNGRLYVADSNHRRYSFSVARLDAALNQESLQRRFSQNAAPKPAQPSSGTKPSASAAAASEAERLESLKQNYLADLRQTYIAYRKKAKSLAGTPLSDFPKLKFQHPPEEIADDKEIRRALLSYWRGGDELRVKQASNVPYARTGKKKTGGAASATQQRTEQQPERKQSRDERI